MPRYTLTAWNQMREAQLKRGPQPTPVDCPKCQKPLYDAGSGVEHRPGWVPVTCPACGYTGERRA